MWKVIHRVLHPNLKPLRVDPDELNILHLQLQEQ